MSADSDSEREVLQAVARALQLVYELVPQPINQRPAFPAINAPTAGSVITASQTAPTTLPIQVSSNRCDLPHFVDLLDADTFAVIDGNEPVTFTGNTGTATITIPTQTGPGPTTHVLQCRAPASLPGNIHRIFINIQAPALPAPPTISLSATAAGMPLPAGTYPSTTPGLNAVVITATPSGGSGTLSYSWTVVRPGTTTPPVVTPANTTTVNLIPPGTNFPTSVLIVAYVTDSHGLNSAPATLSYTITA